MLLGPSAQAVGTARPRSDESSLWISDAADWYSRAICRKRARPAVVVALRANSKQRAAQSSNCFKVALILSVKMLMRRRSSEWPARRSRYCTGGFRRSANPSLKVPLSPARFGAAGLFRAALSVARHSNQRLGSMLS